MVTRDWGEDFDNEVVEHYEPEVKQEDGQAGI